MQALNYRPNCTVLIVGVGLMGQHMARHVAHWLDLQKLILVDAATDIAIAGGTLSLIHI